MKYSDEPLWTLLRVYSIIFCYAVSFAFSRDQMLSNHPFLLSPPPQRVDVNLHANIDSSSLPTLCDSRIRISSLHHHDLTSLRATHPATSWIGPVRRKLSLSVSPIRKVDLESQLCTAQMPPMLHQGSQRWLRPKLGAMTCSREHPCGVHNISTSHPR